MSLTPLSSILTANPVSPCLSFLSFHPSFPHLLTSTLKPADATAIFLALVCFTAVSASISFLKPCTLFLEMTRRKVGTAAKGDGSAGCKARGSEEMEEKWDVV